MLVETATVHSGYDFKLFGIMEMARDHDAHHELFNVEFGAIPGLMDKLHGTDLSSRRRKREEKRERERRMGKAAGVDDDAGKVEEPLERRDSGVEMEMEGLKED